RISSSKRIALLAIFTSIVIVLEVFPVVGITDYYTLVPNFTIDWTGIPIMIVFLTLGAIPTIFTVGTMWIFIAYRNLQGAMFKGMAELFTLLGFIVAQFIVRNRNLDWKKNAVIFILFGSIFRGFGMLFGNAVLFNFFWGLPYENAFSLSLIYVPWNIIQASINVIGGIFLYERIPQSIQMQASFGKYRNEQCNYEELIEEELT
ncbi:MAG: hypothetical protein ACTSQE_14765, partial [Candidatus Heimdallarchaeaceae archaeon]